MEVDARLARALDELFGIPSADLRVDADLESDLQLDSLAIVELQVALEDATGVRMTVDDDVELSTLGDLQAAVERALAAGEPAMPRLELTDHDPSGMGIALRAQDDPSGMGIALRAQDDPSGMGIALRAQDDPSGMGIALRAQDDPSGMGIALRAQDDPSGMGIALRAQDEGT